MIVVLKVAIDFKSIIMGFVHLWISGDITWGRPYFGAYIWPRLWGSLWRDWMTWAYKQGQFKHKLQECSIYKISNSEKRIICPIEKTERQQKYQ